MNSNWPDAHQSVYKPPTNRTALTVISAPLLVVYFKALPTYLCFNAACRWSTGLFNPPSVIFLNLFCNSDYGYKWYSCLQTESPFMKPNQQCQITKCQVNTIQINTQFVKRHVAVASEALVNRTVKKHSQIFMNKKTLLHPFHITYCHQFNAYFPSELSGRPYKPWITTGAIFFYTPFLMPTTTKNHQISFFVHWLTTEKRCQELYVVSLMPIPTILVYAY